MTNDCITSHQTNVHFNNETVYTIWQNDVILIALNAGGVGTKQDLPCMTNGNKSPTDYST